MSRWFVAAVLFSASASIAVAAPTKKDAVEKASDPQDKMICKRFIETGSLVKGTRVCKTKREWDHDRDDIRTDRGSATTCASGTGPTCM